MPSLPQQANHSPTADKGSLTADDIIRPVRDRISDPRRWHGDNATRRGDFGCGGGLDRDGKQVPACDPAAERHCVIGALKLEAGIVDEGAWPLPGVAGEAFDRIRRAAGWEPGLCWNDRDGYEAVRAAVDDALGLTANTE